MRASVVAPGTKDKRGVTSQLMTAFKVEPAKLAGLNSRWGAGGGPEGPRSVRAEGGGLYSGAGRAQQQVGGEGG